MNPIYFRKRPDREPDFLAERRRIHGEFLVVVEGQDELWFFDEILNIIGADPAIVQTIDYGGSGELPVYVSNLLKSEAALDGRIKRLLITGDADTYLGRLPYKLKSTLGDHGLPMPNDREIVKPKDAVIERLGLLIIAHASRIGNLESVLLDTVDGHPSAKDAREFVERHNTERSPINDKRVAQAFLSIQATLSRGAGWGARKGYFDLTHSALEDIKDILTSFIS